MKRLLSICCVLVLLLSLCACGAAGNDASELKNKYFGKYLRFGIPKDEVVNSLKSANKRYFDEPEQNIVYIGDYDTTYWFKDGKLNAMRVKCSEDAVEEVTELFGEAREIDEKGERYTWKAVVDGKRVTLVVAYYEEMDVWMLEMDA